MSNRPTRSEHVVQSPHRFKEVLMTAYDHSSGYTYGTDAVPTSPLTLEDLRQIEAAAHVQAR